MKAKSLMLLAAMLVVAVVLTGCKKKEQASPAPEAADDVQKQAEEMKETVATEAESEKEELERIGKENLEIFKEMEAKVKQTMCPIMDGNKIDPSIFTEYQGLKIYFCCSGCKAKFEADPEKYIANLP